MKITTLLSNLILENSRFQVLFDKVVKPNPSDKGNAKGKAKGLMDFETLKEIIFADPTTKAPENFDIQGASAQDMEKVKVGKFVQWILKNYISPSMIQMNLPAETETNSREYQVAKKEYLRLFMEDLFKVKNDIVKFEKVKQYLPQDKRDINHYTISGLFDYLDTFELPEKLKDKKDKKELKKEIRKERVGYSHPGAEIMLVGDKFTLIKIEGTGPKQREAASWYGGYFDYNNGESNWCTSPPDSSYFLTYAKKGPLYVLLANDDKGLVGKRTGLPQERYQFHFPDAQFMNRADRQIDLVKFLNEEAPDLKGIFKKEFASGLVGLNDNKAIINYPESASGKFVALYGFEELFESLPATIEHLLINNKSKEDIALDVPESLGRFTNLQAILFQNMIKSLPESIGNLKRLNILALPSNKSLESLPVSINKLTNLSFINLKDSNPNIRIPDELNKNLSDEGDGFYYVI
jgi:Leucine-rich repeat (LRR) protein